MVVNAVCFTERGKELLNRIMSNAEKLELSLRQDSESLESFVESSFSNGIPLLFVGAMGICVRSISKYADNKLKDIPVVNVDEAGTFAIPVLSGHVGGANELAMYLAQVLDAIPVITTATDLNDAFSVDLFAKENSLAIKNKDGIKKVSSKALEGKPITISIKDYPPKDAVDVVISNVDNEDCLIRLIPKQYVIGIGCKKGKAFEELDSFINGELIKNGIPMDEVYAVSSIDIKEDEECINRFSRKYKIPFITFDSDILKKAKGDFSSSEFVEKQVGVDNVCERSALLASGLSGKIIVRKTAENGMTIAIAKRYFGQEDF